MKCEEYRKWLSKQEDLEFGHVGVQELQEHLAVCPECRLFRERLVLLGRGLQVVVSAKPPVNLAERVKERVAHERERQLDRGLLPAWTRVPLLVVITLVAIGLGNAAGRSISSMLASETTDNSVEYVLAYQAPSIADVLMENGTGENGR